MPPLSNIGVVPQHDETLYHCPAQLGAARYTILPAKCTEPPYNGSITTGMGTYSLPDARHPITAKVFRDERSGIFALQGTTHQTYSRRVPGNQGYHFLRHWSGWHGGAFDDLPPRT